MSTRSRTTSIVSYITAALIGALPMVAVAQSVTPSETPTAAGALTVSLPQDVTVKAGAEFTLPLKVSEGKNIGSFALSIVYDPTKVDYVKTAGSPETTTFQFIDGKLDADNGMKEVILGGTSSTKIAASGPITLANVTFTSKSTASGVIEFKLGSPADDIGSATLVNGKVTIGSGVAPTSSIPEMGAVSLPPPTSAETTVPPTDPQTTPPVVSEPPTTTEPPSTSDIPSDVPTDNPPSLEPTSEVPTEASSAEDASAAQVSGPDQLDQTGPAEVVGLLALSMGFAYLLQGKRRDSKD